MKTRLSLLLASALASLTTAHAAPDAYRQWAVSKWGVTIAGADNTRATTWGETADPDRDGIPNLLEYLSDTNPTARTPLSDVYAYSVPDSGAPQFRYPQLLSWQRTDDPDVRILCQTSSDLHTWLPAAPADLNSPAPANPFLTTEDTGVVSRGLRQVRYRDLQSIAGRPGAFMRLLVTRRDQIAAGPGIDPFTFTLGQTVATSSTARSSAITLGGFAGSLTITIPSGVTLFVNGVAQTGSTATVKAGDVLWMEATAPSTSGVPRNYTLTIGTQSATWTFTTGTPAAVPDHPGTDSGYTPVETGVSDTGAAQISIPIVVAPGTAGMQPKLSINYSSQGGNGPLGVGFSLSGLSTISRVGRTVAQDGIKGGVNFDANDRFALDGQRLIAINGGDGDHNTEYRLEFDPTSRIYSIGIENGSPQQWTVETKAGLKLRFGSTVNNLASSRIRPEGSLSVLSWAVSEIEDTAGNKMVFDYDDPARQRGEMLVTSIAYTSNSAAGLAPSQVVTFEYQNRPDSRTSFVGGFATKSTQRLTAVESRALEFGLMRRVRRYTATYIQDAINNDSKLTGIQEITADGSTMPATTFEWPVSSSSLFFTSSTNAGFTIYDRLTPNFIGDYTGDGLTDYLDYNAPIADGKSYNFLRATQTGFAPAVLTDMAPSPISAAIPADYNGDGKTDVLLLPHPNNVNGKYVLRFSTGTGFAPAVLTTITPVEVAYRPTVPGDYDGDGRTDLLIWNSARSKYDLYYSTGTNFSSAVATDVTTDGSSTYNLDHVFPGEFNGDGRTDLLVFNLARGKYDIYYASGSTFTASVPTDIVNYSNIYGPGISGDFNGDGLSDFMSYDNFSAIGHYKLYLCTGAGFQTAIVTNITGGSDAMGVKYRQSVDFNGDGRMDMMTRNAPFNNEKFNIYISNGNGFDPPIATQATDYRSDSLTEVGDFNGDGRTDLLVYHLPINGTMNLFLNQCPPPPLVQKVTNGHGGSTSFTYKTLTDSSVHTMGIGLAYPCAVVQPSIYVLSSVTSRNGIDGDGFTPAPSSPLGENTVNYRYEGAWSCLDGRGFMGFKAVVATDVTAGIATRTVYESLDPLLAGRVKSTEQRLMAPPVGGSDLITESEITWNISQTTHATGRKTYFITEGTTASLTHEVNFPSAASGIKTVTRSGPGPGGTVTYDSNGNLLASTTTTNAQGQLFTESVNNTYSDIVSPTQWHLGRLATSSATKTGPNPAGAGTVSLTRSSSFTYHATTGLLTQEVIEPSGGTLRQQKDYTHDGFGNILTSTISTSGEAPRTTTTTYTPDGRFVATTTNAEAHTESKTYDSLLGNVLTQTGPNGLTTSWEYDAIGRPIKETRPDGTVTRSFYRRVTGSTGGAPPRAVHYVRVQSSGSAPKTVWYDLLDREIKTDGIAFDGRTVSAHKVFNNRGEVTHASQPYFAGDTPLYSTMLYDAVGREYQQTNPGNRVTKTTYDGLTTTVERNFNPAALTDFQKAVTVVNAMGWTVQSSQYLGTAAKTITRKYDPYGNLRFVTDPAGNTTELRYDVRGNKTWMSEPNSGTSTFTYNGFGELKTQTNAASQTTTLAYDRLGRVTSRTEPEGVTTFTYDTAAMGIGQLAREAGPGFERRYFYDALARPVATAETHGFHVFSTSRGYDLYSRPESVTYPSGFATRQVYNASGHLSEVQNGANPSTLYWRALQVNARGQVTQEALGNGIVTERAFEAETGIIQGITSTFGSSGDVQKLGFTFDLIGNLTERRDKRFSTHFVEGFGYDTLNRLQTVSTTGAAAVTCAYNDLGNLTSRSDVGTLNYASSGAGPHALTSVTGSSGGALNKTCSYDVKGNRTTDGGTVLDYSSFNKPIRIRKGGDTLSFDYGPDRALYRQTIFHTNGSGATSQTVREYIGGLYEREITSEGLVRHIHHIAGGNGVVAIHTDERSAASAAQRTRFIHKDHLGSVDAITDNNGVVVERQSYDAWGRRRTVTHNAGTWTVTYPAAPASAETHRGFTGHEMLDLVGLVHMGGRIYDPITARFLSPDPFVQSPDNLQNLNRYSYVLNNPLSYTDPSGFFFKSIGKFIGKHWKTIVSAAVGIAAFVYAPGLLGLKGFWGAVAGGAAGGFGSAFSGTLLAGGSIGDALRAGLRGGIIGGMSAGAGKLVAAGFAEGGLLEGFAEYERIAHGVTQGAIRSATGGKFIHGYLSGSISPQFSGGDPIRAAIVGGTVEAIGGGKFANGALTGAMRAAFGESTHNTAADSMTTPVDTILNDLTHLVGFIANLPIAVPAWIAAQVSDSVMIWVQKDHSSFGTGDKNRFFGLVGGLAGNTYTPNEGDRPGLLGVGMSLVHKQGIWGNGPAFEAGQLLGHDNSVLDETYSVPETLMQGIGIPLKSFGFGPVRHILPGASVPILRGLHNGLTPNRSTSSEFLHNGTKKGW